MLNLALDRHMFHLASDFFACIHEHYSRMEMTPSKALYIVHLLIIYYPLRTPNPELSSCIKTSKALLNHKDSGFDS